MFFLTGLVLSWEDGGGGGDDDNIEAKTCNGTGKQ